MNRSKFSSHYKNLPTAKLIELATDPTGLVREALPFLHQELEQRGEHEHATSLKEFLAMDERSTNEHSKKVKGVVIEG